MLSQGVYEACSTKYNALPLSFGEYRSAKEWIDLSNKDFCMVCTLAGYDPRYIYRKAKKISEVKKWFVKYVMHVWVMVIEEYTKTHQKEKK